MIEEYQLTQTLELAKECAMMAIEAENRAEWHESRMYRAQALVHLDAWARLAVQYEQEQYE